MDGEAQRLTREHNSLAWAVWHTASLTAYAPKDGKDFIKLKALTSVEGQRPKPKDWQDSFSAFSAWAQSYKKG